MESPTQASVRVPTDNSEFFRAELEAFVETCKRQRPAAWARVEQLQQACRRESRATAAGLQRSKRDLGEPTAA